MKRPGRTIDTPGNSLKKFVGLQLLSLPQRSDVIGFKV